MGLCGWIVFGFFAGLVARALMPGTQKMGLIATTLLGVAGSFIGGFLANVIWGGPWFVFRASGFIGSVIGAVVLLFIAGVASRRR